MAVPVLPIIGIFVILVLGIAGSAIPPFLAKLKPDLDISANVVFKFFSGLAAGVIIAVGFVHSFPDAEGDLGEAMPDYPYAGLFAMLGALATFFAEEGISHIVSYAQGGSSGHHHGDHSHGNVPQKPTTEEKVEGKTEALDASSPNIAVKADFYTEMYVLLCGLCFHSFFVGMTLGLTPDDVGLLIAIIAHQFFEGLALGFRIARVKLKRTPVIWFIDLTFALSAPVGTAIGIGVQSSLNSSDSNTLLIVQGFFNAFSAGILIYVALVHMLSEEMAREDVQKNISFQISMYVGFCLGAAFMCILAIWA